MKYFFKYRNIIFALTLSWVIYRLVTADSQNKNIEAYSAISIFVTILFLLIFGIGRFKKIRFMRELLPVAFLATAFQLIGLIKVHHTPVGLATLLPPWFSSITSLITLTANFIIFMIIELLALKES